MMDEEKTIDPLVHGEVMAKAAEAELFPEPPPRDSEGDPAKAKPFASAGAPWAAHGAVTASSASPVPIRSTTLTEKTGAVTNRSAAAS